MIEALQVKGVPKGCGDLKWVNLILLDIKPSPTDNSVLTAHSRAWDRVRSPCPSPGSGKTPPAAVLLLPAPALLAAIVVGMAY